MSRRAASTGRKFWTTKRKCRSPSFHMKLSEPTGAAATPSPLPPAHSCHKRSALSCPADPSPGASADRGRCARTATACNLGRCARLTLLAIRKWTCLRGNAGAAAQLATTTCQSRRMCPSRCKASPRRPSQPSACWTWMSARRHGPRMRWAAGTATARK